MAHAVDLRDFAGSLQEMLRNIGYGPDGRRHRDLKLYPDRMDSVDIALHIINRRKIRPKFFDSDLFGEPAFDILLDLFVQKKRGNRVTVSSVCIAAAVPSTTALRYIATLEQRGLIRGNTANHDRRLRFLDMTDDGMKRMEAYLDAVRLK